MTEPLPPAPPIDHEHEWVTIASHYVRGEAPRLQQRCDLCGGQREVPMDEVPMDDEAVRLDPDTVVVRPGDTLIVRVSPQTRAEDAAHLKRQLEERLPGVQILVIGAEQILVARPDSAAP